MTDEETPRAVLLREASDLIHGERNQTYGTPTENFTRIAELWTTLLGPLLRPGARITPRHVADLMVAQKLARSVTQPKRDNYVDIAGYAACAWETQEASVPARPEYLSTAQIISERSWKQVSNPYRSTVDDDVDETTLGTVRG